MGNILKFSAVFVFICLTLSCRKEAEVAAPSLKDTPQPRELVLIRRDPHMDESHVQTIDVTWWEEGKDAVVLFDGQTDLVFTIPYPWHGEDTIIYSYNGDYLWVRTRPSDTSFYLFSMDCSGNREDYYLWEKGKPEDTIRYDSWAQGRIVGFCQHRWEKLLIENPSDIVCIGNLNGVDFDSLKFYPNVEAIGIECIGPVGSYVPVLPRYLKKIPKDIDLYIRCRIRNLDAQSLKRVKKNLKGLFAYVYPWAGKALPSIGKLQNLRQLDIRYYCANDRKLRHLARLKNLHTLTLEGIKISDQGLRYLGEIRSLRSLRLEEFQPHTVEDFRHWFENLTILRDYSGHYSERFDYVRFIEEFPYQYGSLSTPSTTAEGWENFAELSVLEELILYGVMITDDDLRGIGQIKSLRRLEQIGGDITDEGIKYLVNLTTLCDLNLTSTGITDASLPLLMKLTSLKKLNVSYTLITTEGAARLQEALPDCDVVWADRR